MSNITEYNELVAFHPGYYIAEIIEDMGVSQAEFALRMGTNTKTLSNLVNGKANITNDLAKKLSIMMGTSSDMWLNLQKAYDEKVIEIALKRDFEEQASIAEQLDYGYFVDVAGLPKTKSVEDRIANLCRFFRISDLRILKQSDFIVDLGSGKSMLSEKTEINSKAWLQTAINLAQSIEASPYNAKVLKAYLPELSALSEKDSKDQMHKVQQIFSESGVAFVVLPHLNDTYINGAVKWIRDDRVMLAMDDSRIGTFTFWYVLFCEIKHILQQKVKTVFVNSSDPGSVRLLVDQDKEADRFAMRYLK